MKPTEGEMLDYLERRFGPERDLYDQYRKLLEETGELGEAIIGFQDQYENWAPPEGWEQNLKDECADVVLVVLAIAATAEFSLDDAITDKWDRRKT